MNNIFVSLRARSYKNVRPIEKEDSIKKPVIVHTINSLGVGGAEVLFKNAINLMDNYHHVIVYLQPPHTLQNEIRGEVEFICLNHFGWKNTFRSISRLRRIIRSRKPVLIHSHLFEATLITRLAGFNKIPSLTTLHSMFSVDAFTKNRLSLWAERTTIGQCDHLIAVSEYVLQDFLEWVPFKGKKSVVNNFLPESFFQVREKSGTPTSLKCVAVGNLKEAKNYFYLLKVFSLLKDEPISLDIYGVGVLYSDLQKEIADQQLKVRLCGKGSMPGILHEYDLFVQASHHEGFGISVIEAMAMNLPVLLSDIPVFREITAGNAHFFNLHDAASTASIFIKLMKEIPFRNQFVDEGYDHVNHLFRETTYKTKIEKIYQAALKKPGIGKVIK